MLKELTKNDWLSLLNIPENRIPTILVLRGTRNLKANYAKHRAFFTDVFEVGSPNGIFEDVLIGTYKDIDVGYASVYGDAMASEIAHLFGVLGTSVVIQTGCCGALADSLQAELFVFDNPSQGDHILLSDAEKQKRREDGEQALIDTVFAIVENYGNGKR